MDDKFLITLGQIAGIGGISVGTLLMIFRDIVRKKIFPKLTKEQGFRLLTLIIVLVWITAIVGILSWTYAEVFRTTSVPSGHTPQTPESLLSETFAAAIQMLGDENEERRMGGILALERLGRSGKDETVRAVEILSGYIRRRSPAPPGTRSNFQIGKRASKDIYSAFKVIGTLQESDHIHIERINLEQIYAPYAELPNAVIANTDFQYAILNDCDFSRAKLMNCDFSGASLDECDFTGADLSNVKMQPPAHLNHAKLIGANLSNSDLRATDFYFADLSHANLTGADLRYTDLSFADFTDSNLREANLRGRIQTFLRMGSMDEHIGLRTEELWDFVKQKEKQAHEEQRYVGVTFFRTNFTGADLTEADLRGARLKETTGLTLQQVSKAYWDGLTEFPDDIAEKREGQRLPED